MKHPLSTLAALLLLFAGVEQTWADSITGNFTLNDKLQTINSLGQVTFTLNTDGTIGALLTSYGNDIAGFGFDSPVVGLSQSNFSPAVDTTFPWGGNLGNFDTGFEITPVSLMETWTIGNQGDFTSVYQALGGGNAKTEFLLIDSSFSTIGAVLEASVPEPSGIVLLGAACVIGFSYFGWQRSRHVRI